jgi:endonuclease G, mitochondrial
MPQLRRNHQASNSSWRIPIVLGLVGTVLIAFLLLGKEYVLSIFSTKSGSTVEKINSTGTSTDAVTIEPKANPDRAYLPTSNGEIVMHDYYALSYIESNEQAEWVCYKMTQEDLRKPNFPRSDYFEDDPKVSSGSATFYDYKGSGYTKGHLVPAADMAFSPEAMRQTFYMSNMSPQLRGFNNGIWRELEEVVRDWTYHNKELYIVSGPIFGESIRFTKKGVAIPDYFYKVILDLKDPERKAIAFRIPHQVSIEHLSKYAVSIDDIENETGINFFYGILDNDEENKLESSFNINQWKISYDRYQLRVNRWNNE